MTLFRPCLLATLMLLSSGAAAQVPTVFPTHGKWLDNQTAVFSADGSYTDEAAFTVSLRRRKVRPGGVPAAQGRPFPALPAGAVNPTWSPDSSRLAYTRGNDLYVWEVDGGNERRITFDGSDTVLNGYASWVYYEEILGRSSRYRAFWWSPDSRKLGFYRFDNSAVPVFPIYSPFGGAGSLRETRYPTCGTPNPSVRVGLADVRTGALTWAGIEADADSYLGIPFWGADSQSFYVSREPRRQNELDLLRVDVSDGSVRPVYHETSETWLDWIDGMVFTDDGLYMARSFESPWQQIFFLPYDGSPVRRLTDGPNWRVEILRADPATGEVCFLAERDSRVRKSLYRVDRTGQVRALTDTSLNASGVSFSPDGKHFMVWLSGYRTPPQLWILDSADPSRKPLKVADQADREEDLSTRPLPELVWMTTRDGLRLPGAVVYPKDFDPARRYPVHVDLYGGPDTPMVSDRWGSRYLSDTWYAENGIIQVVLDCRASGHNGRTGLDAVYRRLGEVEVEDFVEWGRFLAALPYVDARKIGVEGFSFGGTMTALLVMDHSDVFPYGIAGGGVYDWSLYDTHYTERFMDTPRNNPDGYARTRAVDHAKNYPVDAPASALGASPVMLKLTHGTADDNVHFQHTLLLVDALQQAGKCFELMVYPDGMHGYRGYQGEHFLAANRAYWLKYLKGE